MSVAELKHLPRAEKLKLLEALWQDLSAETDPLQMPEWHLSELEATEARLAAGSEEVLDWQEVKKELRSRLA